MQFGLFSHSHFVKQMISCGILEDELQTNLLLSLPVDCPRPERLSCFLFLDHQDVLETSSLNELEKERIAILNSLDQLTNDNLLESVQKLIMTHFFEDFPEFSDYDNLIGMFSKMDAYDYHKLAIWIEDTCLLYVSYFSLSFIS
jgi:hypothetical protein